MTLQSSGPLKASEIQAEFGGSNPFRLSDYYAGGPNVPAGAEGDNGPIPSSGLIKFSDFYGAPSNVAPDAVVLGGLFEHSTISATASVGYRLNVNGEEEAYDTNGPYIPYNTWLRSLTPDDYEAKLELITGWTPSGSPSEVWIPLNISQAWTLTETVESASKAYHGTIRIRHIPSLLQIWSAGLQLRCNVLPTLP